MDFFRIRPTNIVILVRSPLASMALALAHVFLATAGAQVAPQCVGVVEEEIDLLSEGGRASASGSVSQKMIDWLLFSSYLLEQKMPDWGERSGGHCLEDDLCSFLIEVGATLKLRFKISRID